MNGTPEPARVAIGYTRVSAIEQAREGLSLPAQGRAIRAYARAHRLRLVSVVEDPGVSAGRRVSRRRGGRDLLEAIERTEGAPVRVVIVTRFDRLFRSVLDALETMAAWDRAGVELHVISMGGVAFQSSSALGRAFLATAATYAQLERELVSERVRDVIRDKEARGEWRGGHPPLGFRVEGNRLVEDPDEQRAIRVMRELRAEGLSHWRIARRLDEIQPSKRGKRWNENTVIRQLGEKVKAPGSRDGYRPAFHRRLRYHRERGASLRQLPRLMLADGYEPVGSAFHHSSFARMLKGVLRGEVRARRPRREPGGAS